MTTLGRKMLLEWLQRGGRGAASRLAKELNVQRSQVTKWLSGRVPLLRHAVALERACGIPVGAWDELVSVPKNAA